jgi:hypothetical protein
MRNNFPFEYYDKLINEQINYTEEVHKYSMKSPHKAEVMLCWRNATADAYNNAMLKKMNATKYDVGIRYICKTKQTNGKLLKKDIYNGRPIQIIEALDNDEYVIGDDQTVKYVIDNGEDEEEEFRAIVTKQELDKYFKLAYCVNVYQIQGQSIKSYYWTPCDDCFLDGRKAYTIISRLKGNVYKDDLEDDIEFSFTAEELADLANDFDD